VLREQPPKALELLAGLDADAWGLPKGVEELVPIKAVLRIEFREAGVLRALP